MLIECHMTSVVIKGKAHYGKWKLSKGVIGMKVFGVSASEPPGKRLKERRSAEAVITLDARVED